VREVAYYQGRADTEALRACLPLVLPEGLEHVDCVVKNMFPVLCPCVGHEQGRVRRHVADDGKQRAVAAGHTGRKEQRL
jgi:hypothetical protein